MRALVTGANSLIGSNLVRLLCNQGHSVRAFVRKTSDLRSLEDVEAELAYGDILELNSLVEAARECDLLFHAASIFSYSSNDDELLNTAKKGTINAVEAAKEVGMKRVVLTSSSVIFGSTIDPRPLDENTRVPEPDPVSYITSKIEQEKAGFERAAQLNLDMVAVCPTVCLGPYDYRLSESNAIIVNYLNDPFKATWRGGCNIVSVNDIAQGQILVAEKGNAGELYLLGSENLKWSTIHEIISELCGIQGPLMTANHTSTYIAATIHEIIGYFNKKRPLVSRSQARMVGRYYWYNHEKAASIGYKPIPARQALAKAIAWLVRSKHISKSVRSSMRLSQEVYEERQ